MTKQKHSLPHYTEETICNFEYNLTTPIMLFQSSSITAGAVLAFAAAAFGQTPAGTQPSTSKTLNVRYGSTNVNPGILLPESCTLHYHPAYSDRGVLI